MDQRFTTLFALSNIKTFTTTKYRFKTLPRLYTGRRMSDFTLNSAQIKHAEPDEAQS